MQRILNILAWVGTALVFGAAAVRILGFTDSLTVSANADRYAMYASWAGLALVVLYTLGQWRQIVQWFGGRNARYGTLAGVSVIVGLGILVAVNYLSNRQNKRWDLTSNKQYSLSDQTVKLLQDLKSPVKFLVFDRNTNFERFRSRLTAYEYNSKQVSTDYIDPDQRPVEAKQYKIQQYGTIVVEYMGRKERITNDAEQDITNALIKVLTPSQKKVYFLGGHGEKDTASSDRTGYSGIADALKRDNFEFDKLVLAQAGQVPADATVLVLAGPRDRPAGAGSAHPAGLDHEVGQVPGPDGSLRQLEGAGRDAAPEQPAHRVGHRCHEVRGRGPERPDPGGHGACGGAAVSDARRSPIAST